MRRTLKLWYREILPKALVFIMVMALFSFIEGIGHEEREFPLIRLFLQFLLFNILGLSFIEKDPDEDKNKP